MLNFKIILRVRHSKEKRLQIKENRRHLKENIVSFIFQGRSDILCGNSSGEAEQNLQLADYACVKEKRA